MPFLAIKLQNKLIMPAATTKTAKNNTSNTNISIMQPSTTNMSGGAVTTTEEEDNTTTEDETTQDSECELTTTTKVAEHAMPSIQEAPEETDSEEESDGGEESQNEYGESETEIQFVKALLLEQLGTQPVGRIAPGAYLYLLNAQALTKFVRLTKYHTYGNQLQQDMATKLAVDIARTQQVVTPLSAINTQDGELFVIDGTPQLMALRNLSDGVLEKLTVMLVVYEIRSLSDPVAKGLFTKLNTRQLFTIDTHTHTDVERFMAILLAQPNFREGIKASAANKKANFPHISASELRKSIHEIMAQMQADGSKANVELLANRLIDFNCICKGKPISTLFGLHISGGAHTGDAIDDKTRERYKKMIAKDFYLASPYGRCWPQFLLGRSDTELVAMPKGSSAPVVPVVSQKLSFSLKKA